MRIVILLLLPWFHLAAQHSWDDLRRLQPGDRVRVIEIGGVERTGTFEALSGDGITLRTTKGEITIERAQTRTVKTASARRRMRNLAIGAGVGVAVGATVDQTLGAYLRNETGESPAARALTYIAPAAIFGGIAAAMPAWRTVYQR